MRKEVTFTATDGRDAGKQFMIREMPASRAEAWAIKTLLAAGGAGIEVPPYLISQGMAGLLAIGYANLLKIPYEKAEPLLLEMMGCVQRIETAVTRPIVEEDIEEVATRLKLRKAIWNLHTDFFFGGSQSTSESAQHQPENSLNIGPRRKRSAR
ncbi:hypothetical protein CIW54_07830 [Paraburkholderia sp. T12-10]|nr:hypothetical protein CIW54_07830 [Paraburkholderia sp. T12-10]